MGRAAAGVEALDGVGATMPDQREGVAAEVCGVWLRHDVDRGRGDCGVDRVAAGLEHVHRDERGRRVRGGDSESRAVDGPARGRLRRSQSFGDGHARHGADGEAGVVLRHCNDGTTGWLNLFRSAQGKLAQGGGWRAVVPGEAIRCLGVLGMTNASQLR